MAAKAKSTVTIVDISDGETGATGTGVSSIITQFYLSTSKLELTGGTWSTIMPEWSTGKYLWTRNQIVYKNPTKTEYTTPMCDSSWEAASDVEKSLTLEVSKKVGTDEIISKINMTPESVTIDTKKLNVTDIFAQDVTATGTITGPTLKGANATMDTLLVKDGINFYTTEFGNEAETRLIEFQLDGSNSTSTNHNYDLVLGTPHYDIYSEGTGGRALRYGGVFAYKELYIGDDTPNTAQCAVRQSIDNLKTLTAPINPINGANGAYIGKKIALLTNQEGGNISIFSKNGIEWQIDAFADTYLRFYTFGNNNTYAEARITDTGDVYDGHGNSIKGAVDLVNNKIAYSKINVQFYNAGSWSYGYIDLAPGYRLINAYLQEVDGHVDRHISGFSKNIAATGYTLHLNTGTSDKLSVHYVAYKI